MKKLYKYLTILSLILISSCSSSTSDIFCSPSSNEEIAKTSSSEVIDNSSSSDKLESLWDSRIEGTWYIHSTSNSTSISINDTFVITSNKELTYTSSSSNSTLHLIFTGLYQGYEGACLFTSDSGISNFIISYGTNSHNEDVLDWGFYDSASYSDMGTAYTYAWTNDISYKYEGTSWLMDEINEFIGVNTSNSVPQYNASYYYYHFGYSQMYDDKPYVMIDIFNLSKSCRNDYYNQLVSSSYTMSKDSNGTFYSGFDKDQIYAIRLGLYDETDSNKGYNLNIFIYKYETVFPSVEGE